MPQTLTLADGQFAIQDGAIFNFQVEDIAVDFSEHGEISITIKFAAANLSQIKRTPGDPIAGCVVFEKGGMIEPFNQLSAASELILNAGDNDTVSLTSANNDFSLVAKAKGREGVMFM
jgi:hypothetical protein